MIRFSVVHNVEELVALVNEVKFIPVFRNDIPGFSVEEHIAPEFWFPKEGDGFWEWKGPSIQQSGCAYGKFFHGRAGYIAKDLYNDFANYRRDGYDFDSLWDEGLVGLKYKKVFDILWHKHSMLSKELKNESESKNFEQIMTYLQMRGYVVISDFEYMKTKKGIPYGWGVTRYQTPEFRFGNYFTDNVYNNDPVESFNKLLKYLQLLLPDVSKQEIDSLLKF